MEMIPVAPIKQIILRAGPLGVADYGPPRCHPRLERVACGIIPYIDY